MLHHVADDFHSCRSFRLLVLTHSPNLAVTGTPLAVLVIVHIDIDGLIFDDKGSSVLLTRIPLGHGGCRIICECLTRI